MYCLYLWYLLRWLCFYTVLSTLPLWLAQTTYVLHLGLCETDLGFRISLRHLYGWHYHGNWANALYHSNRMYSRDSRLFVVALSFRVVYFYLSWQRWLYFDHLSLWYDSYTKNIQLTSKIYSRPGGWLYTISLNPGIRSEIIRRIDIAGRDRTLFTSRHSRLVATTKENFLILYVFHVMSYYGSKPYSLLFRQRYFAYDRQ